MLAEILRRVLNERGISVASLARDTGVPRSTLNSWLNNKSNPDINQLDKVARCLGMSMEQLAFGREEKNVVAEFFEDTEIFSGVFRVKISKVDED